MKKNIILTAFLLMGMLFGANAQDPYIEGFYERHGEGQYTLTDVHTHRIYLNGRTVLPETIHGEKKRILCDNIHATMVQFSFEKATTDCPSRWANGFTFQYWDEDNNKWKTDVEACKNQSTSYSQKDMVIMLVLDYSGSMKDNIPRLQTSAINFINSVSDVSDGNVHIGIIAFSGMDLAQNQVFPITPLAGGNKDQFVRFIRDSDKGKETALYYSMDKAIKMMEDYVLRKGFSEDNFNGTCMITFTDGLDNASINDDISVSMHRGRKNEYLAYISTQLKGNSRKKILNQYVEPFIIGYTGSEEFTSEDIAFFREVLQQTTPDENHFKLATRFEEVEEYFRYITQQLTERWETLNMYVGESQYGKVRWVLNCGETRSERKPDPRPDPNPVGRRSPWFGISAEVGATRLGINDYTEPFGGINLDMAFSINNTIAVGGRVGIMIGECYYYDYYYDDDYYDVVMGIILGPEVKITFPNNSAVIAGIGGGAVNEHGVVSLRAGYKTRKSFFVTTETLFGDNQVGFGLGLGFSFGGKQRNR